MCRHGSVRKAGRIALPCQLVHSARTSAGFLDIPIYQDSDMWSATPSSSPNILFSHHLRSTR